MVKFEFELSDIDAENLFGCITCEINDCNEKIMNNIEMKNRFGVEWYKNRIEYLQHLKTKLTNTRI